MIKKTDIPLLILGMVSTFAGLGLARFSYAPLIPEMVAQGWFSASDAAYLGAANLAGYLLGAVTAHWLASRFGSPLLIRLSLVGIFFSFVLLAHPGWFIWFGLWRFVAGMAGAYLMILAPSLVMAQADAERRSSLGVLVFMGIGLGIMMSAFVVPMLSNISLGITWLVLGLGAALACLMGFINLNRIKCPDNNPSTEQASALKSAEPIATISVLLKVSLILVIVAYGLDAVAYVPHSLFWVDFLASEGGLGVGIAGIQWFLFGLGACFGPWFAAWISQHVGPHKALIIALVIKSLGIALALLPLHWLSNSLSSFLVGAMVPAVVGLTSATIAANFGLSRHQALWGLATTVFALGQAASGYLMSWWFSMEDSYLRLFEVATLIMILALLLVIVSHLLSTRNPS